MIDEKTHQVIEKAVKQEVNGYLGKWLVVVLGVNLIAILVGAWYLVYRLPSQVKDDAVKEVSKDLTDEMWNEIQAAKKAREGYETMATDYARLSVRVGELGSAFHQSSQALHEWATSSKVHAIAAEIQKAENRAAKVMSE